MIKQALTIDVTMLVLDIAAMKDGQQMATACMLSCRKVDVFQNKSATAKSLTNSTHTSVAYSKWPHEPFLGCSPPVEKAGLM